jgi:hypothetical protein
MSEPDRQTFCRFQLKRKLSTDESPYFDCVTLELNFSGFLLPDSQLPIRIPEPPLNGSYGRAARTLLVFDRTQPNVLTFGGVASIWWRSWWNKPNTSTDMAGSASKSVIRIVARRSISGVRKNGVAHAVFYFEPFSQFTV